MIPNYAYFGASDKLTTLQRRLTRLDSRSWGLFRKRRLAKLNAKVSAIQQTRAAMGQPPLTTSDAEALAATQVASEEGYLPPLEVQQGVSTGALPGGPVPWIVGGGLALVAAYVMLNRKK